MISNFQEDERTRKPWLPSLDGELHSFDDLFRYLFQNYQYNIIEDIGVSFTRTVKSLVSWLFCCCCYQKNSLYFPKLFCGPSRRIQPGSIEKSKLPFIGFCHTEALLFSKKGHETNIFPVLVKLTHIDYVWGRQMFENLIAPHPPQQLCGTCWFVKCSRVSKIHNPMSFPSPSPNCPHMCLRTTPPSPASPSLP